MRLPNDSITVGVLAMVFIIVLAQALLPERLPKAPPAPTASSTPCLGEPIAVDFAYTGSIQQQWTCKIQCTDRKPRYILYSNGKATQCEDPPGCNDFGEDRGVTCVPPSLTPNASTKK